MEPRSLVNPRELCYLEDGMQAKKSSPSKKKRTTDRLTLLNQRVGPEMFQAIAELGNDGILVFDEHHRIEFANRMASEITGYSNEELLKKTVLSLLGKPNQSFLEDLFIHPERYGEKACTEIQLLTSKGEVKEAEVCIALAQTPLGAQKGYAYLRDITESKRMERRFGRPPNSSRRLPKWGTMESLFLIRPLRSSLPTRWLPKSLAFPRKI